MSIGATAIKTRVLCASLSMASPASSLNKLRYAAQASISSRMLIVRYAASGASISAAPSIRCRSLDSGTGLTTSGTNRIDRLVDDPPTASDAASLRFHIESNSVPTPAPGTTPPAYDPMHAAPPHVFAIGHGLPRPATAWRYPFDFIIVLAAPMPRTICLHHSATQLPIRGFPTHTRICSVRTIR